MEEAQAGGLLGHQGVVPLVEVGEVVVAAVGNGRREVDPVLPLELKHGLGVVEAQKLELRHGSMVIPRHRSQLQPLQANLAY